MPKKQLNKLIAPIAIAGITVGFLVSAYKFVFAKSKETETDEIIQPEIEIVPLDANQAHKISKQ